MVNISDRTATVNNQAGDDLQTNVNKKVTLLTGPLLFPAQGWTVNSCAWLEDSDYVKYCILDNLLDKNKQNNLGNCDGYIYFLLLFYKTNTSK